MQASYTIFILDVGVSSFNKELHRFPIASSNCNVQGSPLIERKKYKIVDAVIV